MERRTNYETRHLLNRTAYATPLINESSLPPNPSIESLAKGLTAAHKAYGPSKSSPSLPTCILILVQTPERNIFDQHHITSATSALVFRLPFSEILTHTSIAESNPARPLIYTPPHAPNTKYEVTTLYFRAGYSPTDHDYPEAWDARLQLERSAAIKCPSVLCQLAGSKKVQQVLATPSSPHLANFLAHLPKSTADRVRNTFSPQYPLDTTTSGLEARKLALNPETAKNYVLKPQREGGGNNIYRAAIPSFLQGMDEKKWPSYILMEMIEPPALRNSIFRDGEVKTGGVISELGVYGVALWKDEHDDGRTKAEVLENWEAGYLLRTKGAESEEGGVAAGFGSVDSALLVDV